MRDFKIHKTESCSQTLSLFQDFPRSFQFSRNIEGHRLLIDYFSHYEKFSTKVYTLLLPGARHLPQYIQVSFSAACLLKVSVAWGPDLIQSSELPRDPTKCLGLPPMWGLNFDWPMNQEENRALFCDGDAKKSDVFKMRLNLHENYDLISCLQILQFWNTWRPPHTYISRNFVRFVAFEFVGLWTLKGLE